MGRTFIILNQKLYDYLNTLPSRDRLDLEDRYRSVFPSFDSYFIEIKQNSFLNDVSTNYQKRTFQELIDEKSSRRFVPIKKSLTELVTEKIPKQFGIKY